MPPTGSNEKPFIIAGTRKMRTTNVSRSTAVTMMNDIWKRTGVSQIRRPENATPVDKRNNG